ncbi:MAG: hypothetical protein HND57_00615 [Planctomycetes bacterium]|nr:hypothetical protein [Planctomycetota bacterium]
MHNLTKVFIVIWALLSVFVLALTIPLAVNKDVWQKQAQSAQDETRAAREVASKAATDAANAQSEKSRVTAALQEEITRLTNDLNQKNGMLSDLRSQLAQALQTADKGEAERSTLTASVQTQATIIETQGTEVAQRREESLRLQQQKIELEDQLRDALTTLDVSLDAQRILQERIAGLNERIQNAGPGGEQALRDPDEPEDTEPGLASPAVRGRVLRISNDEAGTRFAEVDLGTRDGLANNMRFMIARDGRFVANLTITAVDLNRAVGRLQLEQPQGVAVNDAVIGGLRRF